MVDLPIHVLRLNWAGLFKQALTNPLNVIKGILSEKLIIIIITRTRTIKTTTIKILITMKIILLSLLTSFALVAYLHLLIPS